jgi:hypothetical protein
LSKKNIIISERQQGAKKVVHKVIKYQKHKIFIDIVDTRNDEK